MAKIILANHFLKSSTFLLSLLLLICLAVSPLYADSGSIDAAIDMLRTHMESVNQKCPGMDGKVRQIEEKLNAGVPAMECCSDCHMEGGMGHKQQVKIFLEKRGLEDCLRLPSRPYYDIMILIENVWIAILIVAGLLVWALTCCGDVVTAAPYTDSAHGSTVYGVNRSGTQYAIGDCANCHEPTACDSEYFLFASISPMSQTENFCFECHKGDDSVQDPAFNNYNYSYRASGDTSITCPSNILEAFSFINESGSSVSNCDSTYGKSHKLTDIKNFIDGRWGYTANSNPCTACHNLHTAQKDFHTAENRGCPVSRPSHHINTSTWELWGDDPNERMSQYTTYQAPNAASGYEPDGSQTQDGSNLTDYVAFCTDCHNDTNTIYSTVLGRDLYKFDWTTEKHGSGAAEDNSNFEGEYNYSDVFPPYEHTQLGIYVLACTDCHEPHGAPNIFLTRQKANNGDVTVKTGTGIGPDGRYNKEWVYLCGKCHDGLLRDYYHSHPGIDLDGDGNTDCTACHPGGGTYDVCTRCHKHGNSIIEYKGIEYDYGEPLF